MLVKRESVWRLESVSFKGCWCCSHLIAVLPPRGQHCILLRSNAVWCVSMKGFTWKFVTCFWQRCQKREFMPRLVSNWSFCLFWYLTLIHSKQPQTHSHETTIQLIKLKHARYIRTIMHLIYIFNNQLVHLKWINMATLFNAIIIWSIFQSLENASLMFRSLGSVVLVFVINRHL